MEGDPVDWGQLAANWGPAGLFAMLLAFVFRAMVRGDLIPKVSHEREIALMQEANDNLKEGMRIVNERNAELVKQVGVLTPLAETSARSLEAIRAGVSGTQEPV
jgi:hypothetical protein